MQRRSVIGRLAAALTGISLGDAPSLAAVMPIRSEPFKVTWSNLAESSGLVTCPVCGEMDDSLVLTPAGPCLRCADNLPELRAVPHSGRSWILSPQEIRRVEFEIDRLAAKLNLLNEELDGLRLRQMAEGGDRYDRRTEATLHQWHALQRELRLLHLLRAASRQYAP